MCKSGSNGFALRGGRGAFFVANFERVCEGSARKPVTAWPNSLPSRSKCLISRVTGHLDFGIVENLRTGKTIVRACLRPQIQVVRNPTSERQTDQKPKSPPPILSDSHDQHDRPSTRQEQTEPQTKIASGNRNGKSTYGRTRQRSDKQRPESCSEWGGPG